MTGIMEEVREGKEPSMAGHAKYPFFPDNIQFWYETKRAWRQRVRRSHGHGQSNHLWRR
jgi:hypothetical protein